MAKPARRARRGEVCVLVMRVLGRVAVVLALLAETPGVVWAGACDGTGVAEVLAQARAQCCPARNHGAYVSCAAHVCNDAVKAGLLEPSCKVAILKAGCAPTTTTSASSSSTTTRTPTTSTSTTAHGSTSTTAHGTTTTTAHGGTTTTSGSSSSTTATTPSS